jgi:mRNA interferase RelE/StbE
MNIRIDKSFEKDTKKIKDKKLLEKIADTIEQVQASNNSDEIKNLKKLKGNHGYYRIRLGNYRIGISIEGDTVDFIRFLPRKDIYKYFP